MYKLPDFAAERLQEVMDKATESHEECGCQLSLYIEGEQVLELSSGFTGPDRTQKVTPDTLFPVFSVAF